MSKKCGLKAGNWLRLGQWALVQYTHMAYKHSASKVVVLNPKEKERLSLKIKEESHEREANSVTVKKCYFLRSL